MSKISENIHLAGGQLYPEPGDMLLIDPKAAVSDSPYDPTASDYRHYVSKMVPIDGRWYDLKISPAGDKLTLTPSTVPLGSVTNRNESFRDDLRRRQGVPQDFAGPRACRFPCPRASWKLLSYTITRADRPAPAAQAAGKPAAKDAAEKTAGAKPADKAARAKHGSLFGALGQLVGSLTGGSDASRPMPSFVSATATEKYQAVTVRKGETVELPFGPPYTPTVTAMFPGLPPARQSRFAWR